MKTPEDSAKLQFFARAQLATAAAWSPDPKNPPLYLDLPMKDGAPQPELLPSGPRMRRSPSSISTSAICANTAPSPLTSATRTDCDAIPASCTTCWITYGIANTFEIYPAHTPARSPIDSRTMSCRSSARISVLLRNANSES